VKAIFLLLAFAFGAQAAPQRVVSLGGDLTEIAFAVGKGESIAAVDLTSTYPEAALQRPKVGYVRALSAEGILAMKPDLILANGDAGPPEVIEQIKAAGIPVVCQPKDHTLAGIHDKILVVADALGASREGQKLAESFEADLKAVETSAQSGLSLDAVFVMARGDGALIGAGKDTAADAMMAAAGLRNVFAFADGYKPISAEVLAATPPSIVITGKRTVQAVGGMEQLRANPALAAVVGKTRHLVVFDDMYLLGLGPRAATAVRELSEIVRR